MQTSIISGLQRFYRLGRVIGAYRRGRAWRVKYRAGGHYIAKKWREENSRYLAWLQGDLRERPVGVKEILPAAGAA
jgi:hypothetical protein